MQAAFLTPDEFDDWRDAPRVHCGLAADQGADAPACVGVRADATRRWRIDLHAGLGHSCFQDVRCVGGLVYAGHGNRLIVFSPSQGCTTLHPMEGYFGALYTAEDLETSDPGVALLAASASELLCFGPGGELRWRTPELGVDGVLVHRVRDGVVMGDGEWDPPGGWRPFRLQLASGGVISE